MFGRLFHFTFDAIAVSTVLAGIKRASGQSLSPDAMGIPEGAGHTVANQFLGIGEKTFDVLTALTLSSKFFEREVPTARRPER